MYSLSGGMKEITNVYSVHKNPFGKQFTKKSYNISRLSFSAEALNDFCNIFSMVKTPRQDKISLSYFPVNENL